MDTERIQKMMEQKKDIIAKLEEKWNEIPQQDVESQTIVLELLKGELVQMEQMLKW